MAGLNMFCPKPPNTILPKPTPKTIPITAIQKGMVGGKDRENIKQVTKTAEVTGLPPLKVNRASVMIPLINTRTINASALKPKR